MSYIIYMRSHVIIHMSCNELHESCTRNNDVNQSGGICNSYITGPSFVADLLHRKSARAIARGLLQDACPGEEKYK